jgi:hypothetical protein
MFTVIVRDKISKVGRAYLQRRTIIESAITELTSKYKPFQKREIKIFLKLIILILNHLFQVTFSQEAMLLKIE